MAEKPATKPKLRDTCTCCALAKVKCSRDKPMCTRCQERNLDCSYAQSNRYGRLPTSARGLNNASWSPNSLRLNAADPGSRSDMSTGISVSYNYDRRANAPISPLPTPEINPDLLNLTSYPGFDCDSTALFFDEPEETLGTHWNSISGLELPPHTKHDFLHLDTMTHSSSISALSSSFLGFGSLPPMEPHMHELQANVSPTASSSHPLNLSISESRSESTGDRVGDKEPHSCLRISTSLLLQLRCGEKITEISTSSTPFQLWANGEEGRLHNETTHDGLTDHRCSVEGLIAMNRRALEQCMTILFCKCSMLEEVTIILALVAFQVLRRYANVPKTVANADETDSNTTRARAQVVLGDLHGFLPLLEILGRRWEKHEPAVLAGGHEDHSRDASDRVPVNILKGLEAELRCRLQKVNADTVAIIKRLGTVPRDEIQLW